MAKDPVCDMNVNEEEAHAKGLIADHNGQTFYFCSRGCQQDFEQDPVSFINPQASKQDLLEEDAKGDYPGANE